MNCTTCRYELSQCLDGRLPSGRRAVVLQHADECGECGAFWEELQAAQRLTLQLPRPRVSANFRESLWERIKAGEGTPEAVFREPVPLLSKIRYALTGAATAAAVLFAAMWLGRDEAPQQNDVAGITRPDVDRPGITARSAARNAAGAGWELAASPADGTPLMGATQRLTFDVVAVETAKQLEQRHATAVWGLRRLDNDDAVNRDVIVKRVIDSANDIHVFGEFLVDMLDRRRVSFSDADVERELRVAVRMLGGVRRLQPNRNTVEAVIEPALESPRLAALSRMILVAPALDPREEEDLLLRVTVQRPEMIAKLFEINVSVEEVEGFRPGVSFRWAGECGPILVVPRSVARSSR